MMLNAMWREWLRIQVFRLGPFCFASKPSVRWTLPRRSCVMCLRNKFANTENHELGVFTSLQ